MQQIDIPGYQGTLEELVACAHRGDIDLSTVSVSAITAAYRRRIEGPEPRPELREIADFLGLMARLVALKAAAVLPDQAAGAAEEEGEEAGESELGRRLDEYRLYRAAADALLTQASEEGARSFFSLVSPEVIPVERMRIPAESLAAAFRAVLERLAEDEPLPVALTFSVEEKVAELRERLRGGMLLFEELFNGVSTRLEAVACFLALLELLKRGEATVDQPQPFGPIQVTGHG